jgi:outer membrane protein assembly factor BamB
MSGRTWDLAVALALTLAAGPVVAQTPKSFAPPARTAWRPVGCRTPDAIESTFASRAAWRSLHSDEVNTDEVSVAYPPVFHPDWVAEPATWNPTGPVFDDDGNLYFVPAFPYENVALISLDPATGARRWSIPNTTGAPVGGGTPIVLDDPDTPGGQIVYVGLYDRVFAVRPDGSMVWDQPTGLSGTAVVVFGLNHHPGADALVGLTRDGYVYAVDRRTGLSVLTAPLQLPGEVSPPGAPLAAGPEVLACAQAAFEGFADTGGRPITEVIDILLGNRVEVANYFSIDPITGRLWVGATAPDAEDGTVDGVSQLGALYGLDLVPAGPSYTVTEACHVSFVGGSASTPALPHDGSRVYVGDNVGNLLAIDQSCQTIWSLPVGAQITGSIAVAADNHEVYASTALGINQVIDEGSTAHIGWTGSLDVFDLPSGQVVRNANLAGVGANGVAFQAGAGFAIGNGLFVTVGMGLLDRGTGAVRWFTGGLDETVAVMSTGPDGALYIGNSPLRRLFMGCVSSLGLIPVSVLPAVGGITKYTPDRYDLFFRDVVCAGADRAKNARAERRRCAASHAADTVQLGALLGQARATLDAAVASGDLTGITVTRLDRRLRRREQAVAAGASPAGAFKPLCRTIERALRD